MLEAFYSLALPSIRQILKNDVITWEKIVIQASKKFAKPKTGLLEATLKNFTSIRPVELASVPFSLKTKFVI